MSISKKSFSVSVAMAAYNGAQYIKAQIDTILPQLGENDELIISLDPSSDNTEDIIRKFARTDRRVKWVRGEGKGLVHNFSNAIRRCKNDIIFLSDQDDLWEKGKVEAVLRYFSDPKINVVMHDAEVVNADGECLFPSFIKMRGCRNGILKNIFKNSYIGCCMAFRREMKKYILPFPEHIPMHDQWIGLVGEITGKNIIINETLIYYRRHESNASAQKHSNTSQMLRWRMNLVINILKFTVRYYI